MDVKSWAWTWTRTLGPAVVLVAGGVGCGGDTGGGGVFGASCAYVVKYEGRSYLDVWGRPASDKGFTVGEGLGTGLLPRCDDSGGSDGTDEGEEVTVYEVEGIDPTLAVAAGTSPDEAMLVAVEGADLASLGMAS